MFMDSPIPGLFRLFHMEQTTNPPMTKYLYTRGENSNESVVIWASGTRPEVNPQRVEYTRNGGIKIEAYQNDPRFFVRMDGDILVHAHMESEVRIFSWTHACSELDKDYPTFFHDIVEGSLNVSNRLESTSGGQIINEGYKVIVFGYPQQTAESAGSN